MAAKAPSRRSYPVLSIVGTRPEAIKMGPVVRALAAISSIDQRVLLTGQHRGLAQEFDCLPRSAIQELYLDVQERSVPALQDAIRDEIRNYLAFSPMEMVIVQGDTNSALAGALAARDWNIPIAHVEAGLRSFDPAQPWPEEDNRVAIDAIADLLFAPTRKAADNLAAEPGVSGAVHITGNSGIDALVRVRNAIERRPRRKNRTILVTCHRRENQGPILDRICNALKRLTAEMPVDILFVLHPNRLLRGAVEAVLAGEPRIRLVEPVSHGEMVRLMLESWLILTDSGGLQEEGPALGRPVFVLRDVTERIEAPASVQLVGTDPSAILSAVNRLLMDEVHYTRMARPAFPFGDGLAGPRIARLIEDYLVGSDRLAL